LRFFSLSFFRFLETQESEAMMHQKNIYFYSLLVGLLATAPVVTKPPRALQTNTHKSSDEEAFLIRRIAEFWKDGDYDIVKSQIHQFLDRYPKSTLSDYLQGILGDLYIQEAKYDKAVTLYSGISDPNIIEKILLNKLQAYYELNRYSDLSQEGEEYLYNTSADFSERRDEYHFLMGEAYFRRALNEAETGLVTKLASQAKSFYEGLLDSEYKEVSSFALAEIYRMLNENEKGATLYLQLAETHPEKREQLLFNAAVLQARFDKTRAMNAFDRVIELKGEKAKDASYNRLLLAFQTEQYGYVVENHVRVFSYVPEDQVSQFHFIVGKSYYAIEDYQNASTPVTKYLASNPNVSDQYKDALLIQMTCAKAMNDEPLFAQSLASYRSAFPQDRELGKAHFMHAMLCREAGNYEAVENDLETIMREFPSFEDKESLLYEYGLVMHQNGKWRESYGIFQDYLTNFSDHPRAESAWRHFLSCCLNISKNDPDHIDYSRERFLTDLKSVLSSKNGLNNDERREYRLVYAKLSYEVGYHNEALLELEQYLSEYSDHDSAAEAHMLSALCLNRLNANLEQFCAHLEKAIELNPKEYDNSAVHLQLYNGYITLNDAKGQHPELTERAAEHLYAASKNPKQEIRHENRMWLAGHFYAKVKSSLDQGMDAAFDRSLELYQDAFARETISAEHTDFEPEILKFADLLSYKHDYNQKLALLKDLVEVQNQNHKANWKHRRQALFELAQTYEALKQPNAALETYKTLLGEANGAISPITSKSHLRSSLLTFNQIPERERKEKNEPVLDILNQLKEIQIRKTVDSEPTHLEAALSYANIRAELSESSRKTARYLFFLVRMKEDYTSNDDIINQEYHTALAENSEKQALFDGYMQFVEAEIFRMQALQLTKEDRQEAQKFRQLAGEIYTELQNNKAISQDLRNHVANSVKALEKHRIR